MREAVKVLLKKFNSENPDLKVFLTNDILWHIGMIISITDYLKNNNPLHSSREIASAQFEASKIAKLKDVNEIIFCSPSKGKISIKSPLNIWNLTHSLPNAKENIGRPKNEALYKSLPHIRALIAMKVPIELIASIFDKDSSSFKRQLSRIRTKG